MMIVTLSSQIEYYPTTGETTITGQSLPPQMAYMNKPSGTVMFGSHAMHLPPSFLRFASASSLDNEAKQVLPGSLLEVAFAVTAFWLLTLVDSSMTKWLNNDN